MKEQVSRSRGPFHPTEIPSPVFGFNRPKKSDTIVEHELSRFLQEDFENGVDHLIEADVETPASVTEILIETSSPALEEIFQAEETLLEEHVEQVEAVEESFPEPEPEFESEPEPETEPELEFESELEPEPEPEIVSDPEIPAQKRSKLPFNVMMLKQDKQKWEEKKRTREMEQKAAGEKEKKAVEIVNLLIKPLENNENESLNDSTYILPKSNLLNPPVTEVRDQGWLLEQEELLNQTLRNFNVGASVVNVTQGPSVTRFEVQPEPGVKVNKITNLSDDIKLSLAARDIRIEAPIPGKHTIGIEVPNHKSRPVLINEIIGSSVFSDSPSPLTAVLGLDIAGNPIVTDLKKMPHGLIAGATGSGKSVCINSILVSLIYKARPEDVKLLLIDPKMVELAPYNRIPHLVSPVITDVKAATAALKWAVDEMERRYELFAHTGVRDIGRFNELAIKHKRYSDKLPFIVIIIDELADLMMMSPADVEEAVCRIAQKARACGIHLILATQRPSVDVITGLIKANIPTRIAFSVSSQVDSRTIIDISGAEKLLGRGDMLFLENGSSKPVRLQGTYVSDEEIDLVVAHVREQREPEYLFEQEELLKKAQVTEEEDELFFEACEFIVDQGGASTSSLQRRFKIGYNRAARLMDLLEKNGYITGANGSKPRDVLITAADLEAISD
ncbi:DNA translocase FtsK [Bacillus sp. S3]|nr:DNA translocase FtsK [Bacillus sp. S3]